MEDENEINKQPEQDQPKAQEEGSAAQPENQAIETSAQTPAADLPGLEVGPVATLLNNVQRESSKVLIGQQRLVEQLLVALLAKGNVLIEGVPGIAKTLASKTLARCISSQFTRIQFTPDLMPADILGSMIYNMKEGEFEFRKGPIFSNIILIDEVNRAPAKTQAALIEVMEERQVTVEGTTYAMEEPFFILATQNPVEQEGTYKLPEAQMDRFIFRINLDYPGLDIEREILKRFQTDFEQVQENEINAVLDKKALAEAQALVQQVHITEQLIDYIANIVVATRENGDLYLGASPRASLAILKCAKALALVRGRNFVVPEDIQEMAYPVLDHRIILSHEREMEGLASKDIVKSIIDGVEVPR